MTLRSRVALARQSFWLPVLLAMMGVVAAVGFIAPTFMFAASAGALVAVAWIPVAAYLVKRIASRHQARLEAALVDGEDDTYCRLLDESDEYYRVYAPESKWLRLRVRYQRLSAEERWSEALAVVTEMDRETVPPAMHQVHDNLVAWCCAHAGETARAVELARANVAEPADERTRTALLSTLGAALVLDGQPAAALEPLRESLALGGPRWAHAVRRYYLGEALMALGRPDEARAEYGEAVTIASKSRWGRRAQARLDAGPPAAYR